MSTGFGLIFWNVEIVKHIKMKDIFRRGSSLKVYTSAGASKNNNLTASIQR